MTPRGNRVTIPDRPFSDASDRKTPSGQFRQCSQLSRRSHLTQGPPDRPYSCGTLVVNGGNKLRRLGIRSVDRDMLLFESLRDPRWVRTILVPHLWSLRQPRPIEGRRGRGANANSPLSLPINCGRSVAAKHRFGGNAAGPDMAHRRRHVRSHEHRGAVAARKPPKSMSACGALQSPDRLARRKADAVTADERI